MMAHGYRDSPFFVMKVRRDKLIEDSLDSVQSLFRHQLIIDRRSENE